MSTSSVKPCMRGRSLLTLEDVSDREMLDLIALAEALKRKKAARSPRARQYLRGRSVAMIFEKASTRTRCAATVACFDEGAHVEYLGKSDIHFGRKESVADTARVLGRMFDGILFRGFAHDNVVQLARYSGVPVWNGLTDDAHPTQILADLMTIKQTFGRLRGLQVVFVGDGRNNVSLSLMLGCAKAGVNFVVCSPPELAPGAEGLERCREVAAANGSRVTMSDSPSRAVVGANVIYTDAWVSMGEEHAFEERLRLLRPYQVDMAMMRRSGHLDDGRLIFLHCLPAFHNHETELTRELGALEVTDEVFEAPFSKVFDQAENRVHTIKAVMVATLA